MTISPQSGARGLEKFIWLKYYNIQKWQITFTWGLNAVKISLILKKKGTLTFLVGIQCSTTFIWSVFSYNAYFWQCRALKYKFTFPFFVHYNILKMAIFGEPSSTPGVGRHIGPLTFLDGIQCSTTFIWSVFTYNAYFWQRRALKWIYFAIFIHYNISKMAIFGTLLLHSWGR